MKTILVTGGAGFIGSNFVRHPYRKDPNMPLEHVDVARALAQALKRGGRP